MRLLEYFAPVFGAAIILSVSCSKETTPYEPSESGLNANVTLSVTSVLHTKAGSVDGNMNTVEVFVFDGDNESTSHELLEAYKKASGSELSSSSSAVLNFNASTGLKHIYVLVNAKEAIGKSITTEKQLKEQMAYFEDYRENSLLMVGGVEVTLNSGNDNDIAVPCRRLVSKIRLGSVESAFESEAMKNLGFSLDRVFLMNVPKKVRLINGDAKDIFGISGTNAFTSGESRFPEGFIPAIKDSSTPLPFYLFDTPDISASSLSGFYNWYEDDEFRQNKPVRVSEPASALTLYTPSSEGNILNPNRTLPVDKNFYTFPNPYTPSKAENEIDYVTKLVIETTLQIDGRAKKYYYPISIPYTQPNYFYNIDKLIIKRLGSDNPSHPVTTAQCSFNVTVTDWFTGKIVGEFSNEISEGVFEF